MSSLTFERNKQEALKNLIQDKRKSAVQGDFNVNGQELDTDTQLSLEYINLYNAFINDFGENFPALKYDKFRTFFLDLRDAIEAHIETGEYDAEVLKQIMVHLNLELGTDVNFSSTFEKMLKEDSFQPSYSELKDRFTFECLYSQYNTTTKTESQGYYESTGTDTIEKYNHPDSNNRGRRR